MSITNTDNSLGERDNWASLGFLRLSGCSNFQYSFTCEECKKKVESRPRGKRKGWFDLVWGIRKSDNARVCAACINALLEARNVTQRFYNELFHNKKG